jgi:hypothetical protein
MKQKDLGRGRLVLNLDQRYEEPSGYRCGSTLGSWLALAEN